ncbi:DUF99 family protein [Halosegnis marinus]|uniref:UPF0215 protein ACFQJ4_08705 n=1 Tax=Halosegnis marinus TaxID=3034023 RepID=A0ABD5ZPH8_9EURY|nr:DUF99 family protein [Halosegnis sp. DT85]
MKPGVRAVGVAESYDGREGSESTLAAAVVRRDRAVDGLAFGRCTVGGTDATDAVADLLDRLDRPDARYLFLAGVAPAWFNLLDLPALRESTDRPVLAVSFEASPGLADALASEFSGDALTARREVYERQPPRRPVSVNGERVWVRVAGLDDDRAAEVVRAFTPEGGRPEPLRVARLAARAGDAYGSRPNGDAGTE